MKIILNKRYKSELIVNTDLHAGGHLFGLVFFKILVFKNNNEIILKKEVIDPFMPMDLNDVKHINSFNIKGKWEIVNQNEIHCQFDPIFLTMKGVFSTKIKDSIIFHCYDHRLSKQWGELYG